MVQDFKQIDDDLYINPVTGDFDFVDSDNQHILDILQASPGWWKNAPTLGANLNQLLKSKVNTSTVEGIIKTQLESDMYQVSRPSVQVVSGKATIIPNATRV